jgi:PAS domain S-box-containing protein
MRRGITGYAVAILSVAIATLIIELTDTTAQVAMYMLAVFATTWFGGTRPGVLATVLSVPALMYFLPPAGSFNVEAREVGRIIYFVFLVSFVIWIIASERRAADLLRRREGRLRQVIDSMPTMAWILGDDGKMEFINRRWLDYTGLTPQQAIDGSNRTIHPDDYEQALEKWRAVLLAGTAYEDEMRLRRADGQYRWFLVRTVAQRDESGKILRWYGTSTDIEDRKRVEKELREVVDTMPAIAWTARADGTNEFTNRSWNAYTGLSVGDTSGTGWQTVVHPDDVAKHAGRWMTSTLTGEPFENEARYRGKDGEYRWFLVRAVALRDEQGRILRWYGMLADIEDRRRAEQELRDTAGLLQALSRRLLGVQEEERRHLARELHDEFGQILAAIGLRLHAARAGGATAPANLEQCIELVELAGERVRGLALELRPPMIESAGLDATLRWLAGQRLLGAAVHLSGQAGELPREVAVACFRVAQEALTNVARHARAHNVWIELARKERSVELAVRDDGTGFDSTRALAGWSAGGHLGLLGMRERVQILNGALQVESQPGRGTTIRVSLPAPAVAPAVVHAK